MSIQVSAELEISGSGAALNDIDVSVNNGTIGTVEIDSSSTLTFDGASFVADAQNSGPLTIDNSGSIDVTGSSLMRGADLDGLVTVESGQTLTMEGATVLGRHHHG